QLPSVLPADLLGRRPDVVAARWRVEAADKDIAAAKTRFYPSLNLTALGGAVNKDVGQLLKSESLFGIVAPALSLPIFDGGRLRADLAGKDAQYDLAVADYNEKVVQALRDVADQVNAVRSLDQRTRSQAEALATAASAHDLARQRFRAGIGSYLEVLSVEEQLLAAQQRMATLQSEQILASVKLRRALGGGFAPEQAAAGSAAADATTESKHS
ncbi:MAG TPA: multidrug RND transporter, partial [Xanthomonadaceae bacterium]|nr:multidrug RND transporter [Xanthomonadaceae bacterium]